MPKSIQIAWYTIFDQTRQKSLYILLALAVFFVLMAKSCSGGSYTVNGKILDNDQISRGLLMAAFYAVNMAALLITVFLSMGAFSRDRTNGALVLYLSKPIHRFEYIIGKVLGIWLVSFAFMLILQGILFISTIQSGSFDIAYIPASLLCGVNLLGTVTFTFILSLYMPDFVAAILTVGIGAVSFISESAFLVLQTGIVKQVLQSQKIPEPPIWVLLWPKFASVQNFAASLVGDGTFFSIGPVHPLINMGIYIFVMGSLMVFVFNKKELKS